jgi:hypothetical protein
MTVIIDALNGVTRFRPRSNVFEERSERVLPALADGNSSPAVVRKILRVRIQTTSPQVQPYLIFRRVALAVRALSARQDLAGQQSLCAAATLRMPVAEARTPDLCFSAAVTTTTPQTKSLVRFSPRRPKHHQPTKPLPGHVREAAHCVLACRTTKPSRPATHAVGPCKELHAASLTDAGHATLGLHLETHPFAGAALCPLIVPVCMFFGPGARCDGRFGPHPTPGTAAAAGAGRLTRMEQAMLACKGRRGMHTAAARSEGGA